MSEIIRRREVKTGLVRNGEEEVLLLTDDGYRINAEWLSGKPGSIEAGEQVLWAEYKHCDMPYIGDLIAALLMTPNR